MITVSPSALRRFHKIATIVWAALIIPTVLWWKDSVQWVAVMSVWANVASHFASYQGARAEDNNSEQPEHGKCCKCK